MGALVVKVYHQVQQLNPGGAGVLTPILHQLKPAACPLIQWGGKHLLGPTPSLPSLTPLNHRAGALLLLLILRWQKRAKRMPNPTEGKGSSCSVDNANDGCDKYDDEDDIIPATDGPILTTAQDAAPELFIAEKSAELIEKHRQEFMKSAFSVRALAADVPLATVSASIKICRLQKRTLTISSMSSRIGVWAWILRLWALVLKGTVFPSFDAPTTMVPRCQIGCPWGDCCSWIQLTSHSSQTVRIDEWHRDNGHMGQERTWGYCKEKYYNISQSLVRLYCETCPDCMKKNPITQPRKGSRKSIRSRCYRDRFQIDLIDFSKLRKMDPFGVRRKSLGSLAIQRYSIQTMGKSSLQKLCLKHCVKWIPTSALLPAAPAAHLIKVLLRAWTRWWREFLAPS